MILSLNKYTDYQYFVSRKSINIKTIVKIYSLNKPK